MSTVPTLSSSEDLHTLCAKEPIHRPGSLQPFATVLIGAGLSDRILHCGANLSLLLDLKPAAVLEKTLSSFLPYLPPLAKLAKKADSHTFPCAINQRPLLATLLLRSDHWLLQLEPAPPGPTPAPLDSTALLRLCTQPTLDSLLGEAAHLFRTLLDYPRVMIYRFHPDWHGEVVAESSQGSRNRYLHLHFPATDIPPQARDLYLKECLRLIPDIAAEPVPLFSAPGAPPPDSLDLSGLPSRACSPVHRRYLANMGVRATLATSLIVQGRLWGLMVCHHDLPFLPHPSLRTAAAAFSELLSAHITSRLDHESSQFQSSFRQAVLQLSLRLGEQSDPWLLFQDLADTLLSPLSSCGLAFLAPSRSLATGHTPPPPALLALASWLDLQPSSPSQLVSTEQLPTELTGRPDWPAPIAGLLAARVNPEPHSPWLTFFRHEWPREIAWGGDPRQTVSQSPDGHLDPRASFAVWTEIQRHRSRPWIDPERDYVRQLALTLRNGLLMQERLASASKIKTSEQRRAAILDAMPDLLFVLDPEGYYLDAHIPPGTPALASKDQLLGRRLREVLPADTAELFHSALARLFSGTSTREALNYSLDLPHHGTRHYESRLVPSAPGQVLCLARDITRRHLAQLALEEERSLLKTIFEDSLAGYWDIRFDTGHAFYSDAYLDMLGLTREDCPPTPDAWHRFAFPEDVAAAHTAFQHHIASQGEIPYRNRIRFHHRDGSTVHIICSGRVVSWSATDEPLRAVGCHIDFTSLYESQETVSRLALVARHTASAVIFTDAQYRILWVNDAFTRITGYSELEAITQSPSILYGPETDPATLAAIRQSLAENRPFRGEILNYNKSGHLYWIDLEIIPHHDHGRRVVGFIGVQIDITERKNTELALRARDERFAAISRHVPGVIYQYRLTAEGVGRFLFVTEGAERIWGFPPSAIVNQDNALADRVHPDDLPRLQDIMRRSAESLSPAESTIRYHHPTLGLRHLRSTDSPTRESDGSTLWYGYAFDVTELVQAQQALRDNEASLNTLLHAIPSSIFLKDAEGRFLFINQIGLHSLGIADLDWHGRTDLEIAEQRPSYLPIARACTASDEAAWALGTRSSGEETIPQPNGSETVMEVIKVPLFNPDGSRRGLVVIATDITARKRAAELLDRERRLFAVGPVAVIVWDNSPGWPVNYVSANIQTLLGYPAATFTHPDFRYLDLIHPDDRLKLVADTHARLVERAPFFEASYRLRHLSGEYRWIYDFTQPEYDRDQNLLSIRGFLFDQTKLKQAQDALLQREKQIATISHHIPGMLYRFALRPDGTSYIPYASEGIQKLFALSHEQVRQNASTLIARIHPEDQARFAASVEASRSQLAEWSMQFRIHHPEHGVRWLHGSSSPRLLENGDYVWDGYCFDITDRKKAEEDLLREGKREAIERLAGGVAHDFNNYLTSLALSADLLVNQPDLPLHAREIAVTISSEIDAATSVARQLLAFTKDQPIHLEPISLESFLRDCAAFALRGSPMRALVDVADRQIEITSDPDLLRQVLFNLILNSRQALNEKGNILLSAKTTADHVTLQIADTGPGIPQDQHSKIFEPYFTTKSAGSGLGLFVVRSIIRRLGGDILLDPLASQGACFLITLPLTSSPSSPSKNQLPAPPAPAAPLDLQPPLLTKPDPNQNTHVLILEDDPIQTKLLASFFSALEVNCRTFKTGEALLAAAPAYKEAGSSIICMLDITVAGGQGGLEVAPTLRSLLPHARLFLVSGYSSNWQEKEKTLASLQVAFIAKPYHLRDLKNRLFGLKKPSKDPA